MIRIFLMTFVSLALSIGQVQAKTLTEVEGNNIFDNAQTVDGYYFSNIGGTYSAVVDGNYSGVVGGKSDYDYYKFSLHGNSSVSLELSGFKGKLGLWQLNSADGTWSLVAQNSSTARRFASIGLDIDGGTYILGVAANSSIASGAGFSGGSDLASGYRLTMSESPTANPEPSAFLLTGMGLLGLFGVRRKFSRAPRASADNVA